MVDNLSFLYNDEEKLKYTRILEKAHNALKNHTPEPVCFVDPFWQEMSTAIANQDDEIKAEFFGGINNAESKFLVFAPWYIETDPNDYVSVICFDNPFNDIKHSDVLGKILSLGVDRRVVGDIIVSDKVYVVVGKSIEGYILTEFRDIRRHSINPYTVQYNIDMPKPNYKENTFIVPSMRLDAVVSKIYNISRNESQDKISKGLLKLNYRVLDKTSYEITEKCLLSLRGYGRVRVVEVLGQTQKGNLRIKTERLI